MNLQALIYLASKFEKDKRYTEKEVNELFNKWHTFTDSAILRRELYNHVLIGRERTGKSYWLEPTQPTTQDLEKNMDKEIIKNFYDSKIIDVEKTAVGAGSDTYFITCEHGKYVVKYPYISEMNNPDNEPDLCEFLLSQGICVSEFIKNREGNFVSKDENGRKFHLQKFVEGKMYELNAAPKWLLNESARLLGKIHTALIDYPVLPEGIGSNFFKFMTPATAMKSYMNTLSIAKKNGDSDIENDLIYRIELMNKFPHFYINLDQLTCRNTHGDFFISQFICGDDKINAVIDWTTACIHPVVWEIVRSYVYASPKSKEGEIDIREFIEYVSEYLLYATLNTCDIKIMPKLFYYQIAVCDYYNQYYQSETATREIYLHQAVFSTKLMKWFEKNVESLTEELIKLNI